MRILIADDHPIVRSGIRSELAESPGEFELVAEALNGDDALALAITLQPDCLLLDVNMPGKKSVQVLVEVKRGCPSCKVIILTAYGDAGTALGMLKAGADGYVLKDEDPAVMVEAIRSAQSGNRWISQAVRDQIQAIEQIEPDSAAGSPLTTREREVFSLIVRGSTNKEIAEALQISLRTAEYHVSNVLEKLGVGSRVEALLWAKEHSW